MEDFEVEALSSSVGKHAPKFTLAAIMVNQHHFLAGRRSWKVGYDDSLNMFYVETATFERSSHAVYEKAESSGLLREDIKQLWVHLVVNFAAEIGVKLITSYLPPGYEFVENVAYRADAKESGSASLNAPWFAQVLKRHPGLVRDL